MLKMIGLSTLKALHIQEQYDSLCDFHLFASIIKFPQQTKHGCTITSKSEEVDINMYSAYLILISDITFQSKSYAYVCTLCGVGKNRVW